MILPGSEEPQLRFEAGNIQTVFAELGRALPGQKPQLS